MPENETGTGVDQIPPARCDSTIVSLVLPLCAKSSVVPSGDSDGVLSLFTTACGAKIVGCGRVASCARAGAPVEAAARTAVSSTLTRFIVLYL